MKLWQFLPAVNLAIFTTWSLFNSLSVPVPHLLLGLPFLVHQPSPCWKSQIAHFDMHQLVFGINFHIHFVSLTIIPFLSRFTSSFICQPTFVINHHSFTVSIQAKNLRFSTNHFHLNRLLLRFYLLDCLFMIMGPDGACSTDWVNWTCIVYTIRYDTMRCDTVFLLRCDRFLRQQAGYVTLLHTGRPNWRLWPRRLEFCEHLFWRE